MSSPISTTDPLFPSKWMDLAERIFQRFAAEFPELDAWYGHRGRTYGMHDNAYLLAWLIEALDVAGSDSFRRNVEWLRSVLDARRFPMHAFQRNLEMVGEAIIELRPADTDRIHGLLLAARARDAS